MNLIVETDLGHDPDDFFTLCYLHEVGVNVRCILIVPGDPDQIAIAKLFTKMTGLDIPIGVTKFNNKLSSGGIHHFLCNKYGQTLEAKADGNSSDILIDTIRKYPDSESFIIGPCTTIGEYCSKVQNPFKKSTMQGGFLSYNLYRPEVVLPQFENKDSMPTFNLNGDIKAGQAFISAKIEEKRFVGKNVCHTLIYDLDKFYNMKPPKTIAGKLYLEAMEEYLSHHDGKKFHDPCAAVCHLHPEIGTWVKGKILREKNGWKTVLEENGDYILADIDREKF